MLLLRYDKPVRTVFDLLGRKEDDMTYALGFVCSRSPMFVAALVKAVGGTPGSFEDGSVALQTVDHEGRTDVEIRFPGSFHAVFEAKRGFALPTDAQLMKYVARLRESEAVTKALVAVTNATHDYAAMALKPVAESAEGITVKHVAWREIRALVRDAMPDETNANKRLLKEFDAYLTEILGMENARSNMVYVVSLGGDGVWGLSFREVVEKRARYFYPTKGHWPHVPPNYIAFRYDGKLQSIHHVERYEVFDNPRVVFTDATVEEARPHFLLHLGPPIRPPHEVRTGDKIVRSARVWCMIDLLLTSKTITEARDFTKQRLGPEVAGDVVEDGD
ncbi:MAG TPA: hypothetical protein PLI95_28805 [Polyangiaceae bacterium]|nr:hypothetical protein [Polyangiaceae bacterium]